MPGTKEIKRRINSVKNTKKITKAMELVSASKMKRAVSSTLRSRLYAKYSWDILTSISNSEGKVIHPLFTKREKKEGERESILLMLITSNRGLCGAYNAQIIKTAIALIKKESVLADIHILTLGKKGDVAMRRVNQDILASFFELPDNISLADITPISELVITEYNLGKYDKVLVAYTDFVSALTQRPNIKRVLPISKTNLKELIDNLGENINEEPKMNEEEAKVEKEQTIDYLFEGNKEKFISSLAQKLTKMQIYQMVLESNASEQSSRMMAMKNASEASGEMIDDLTLAFNKARQANITREISEISAGMASVG